jgi:RNA polymerase II subunit A small phosphatase-like protein
VRDHEKLLILDLDETLVFGTRKPLDRYPDFTVHPYGIYKRPHLDEFLRYCQVEFSTAVWSSSSPEYAARVVAHIFDSGNEPLFLWARDRCTPRFDPETKDFFWIKDLKKLKRKGHALESVLMVDDSSEKLQRNYGNHIRVSPYFGASEDDELQLLARYLETIKKCDNVRVIEKRGWKARVRA